MGTDNELGLFSLIGLSDTVGGRLRVVYSIGIKNVFMCLDYIFRVVLGLFLFVSTFISRSLGCSSYFLIRSTFSSEV